MFNPKVYYKLLLYITTKTLKINYIIVLVKFTMRIHQEQHKKMIIMLLMFLTPYLVHISKQERW